MLICFSNIHEYILCFIINDLRQVQLDLELFFINCNSRSFSYVNLLNVKMDVIDEGEKEHIISSLATALTQISLIPYPGIDKFYWLKKYLWIVFNA